MAHETQKAKIERLEQELWEQKVLINQQLAEIKALKGQLDHEKNKEDNYVQKLESEQYDVDSFEFWEETRKLAENTVKKLGQELEFYDREEDKYSMLLDKLKEFEASNLMLKAQNKELAKKVARGGRKQKFTEEDKTLIKMYRLQGKTVRELAEMFNCSVGLVHNLVSEQKKK